LHDLLEAEGDMEGNKSNTHWSVSRADIQHGDETRVIKTAAALGEIERAVHEAFPAASEIATRVELCDFLVKFVAGQKTVSVRFSSDTLEAYRRCQEASRLQALKTLRLVCNFVFAREYAPDDDPANPLVIDAKMALSNTLT